MIGTPARVNGVAVDRSCAKADERPAGVDLHAKGNPMTDDMGTQDQRTAAVAAVLDAIEFDADGHDTHIDFEVNDANRLHTYANP